MSLGIVWQEAQHLARRLQQELGWRKDHHRWSQFGGFSARLLFRGDIWFRPESVKDEHESTRLHFFPDFVTFHQLVVVAPGYSEATVLRGTGVVKYCFGALPSLKELDPEEAPQLLRSSGIRGFASVFGITRPVLDAGSI